MDIGELNSRLESQAARLREARTQIGDGIPWYPYDILGNVSHIDRLLTGAHRDLAELAGGLPVADIGAADGDLSFALEDELGWQMHIVDTASTNHNGLRAARALRDHFGSQVEIHDIDLDAQFSLPADRYGLVLLLGILYHLQNPFFTLRTLARHSDHLLLSTRVARYAGPHATSIAELPVAYLVGPTEANNDPTNYWMFSPAGLERIVTRAGWTILDQLSAGDTERSDPSSRDHDERCFLLLRNADLATGGTPPAGAAQAAQRPRSVFSRLRRG